MSWKSLIFVMPVLTGAPPVLICSMVPYSGCRRSSMKEHCRPHDSKDCSTFTVEDGLAALGATRVVAIHLKLLI